MADREISDVLKNSLLYFDGVRYDLGVWVIMPNHAHIIVTPRSKYLLEQITHSWKSFSANEINRKLKRKGTFWQGESYDHIVRNEKQLKTIERYIIENPQKAKLKRGFQLNSYDN